MLILHSVQHWIKAPGKQETATGVFSSVLKTTRSVEREGERYHTKLAATVLALSGLRGHWREASANEIWGSSSHNGQVSLRIHGAAHTED